MQAPARSGSFFFNYKKSHSIVLMAVCNADYQFTLIDVGDTGRNSDSGVFANSAIGDALQQNLLNILLPESISGTTAMFPYVLIGDEAFPLKDYLMKPYPREVLTLKERIFNYRLSRGRRIIENCFGILTARCRIFQKSIVAREEVVINVTKAAVALHNFLMCGREFEPERFRYCPSGFVDHETPEGIQEGRWRRETETYEGLSPMRRQVGSNNYTRNARSRCDTFPDFFSSQQGQVPWQYEMVTSTQNSFDLL